MITDSKLKFWIDNNLNVLFCGAHGVGKTARIKEAFDEAGLKWLYFSAATLDPWVDFIGIPKEAQDEKGNKFIELIRPKPFANDEVQAIFLDEFNRSPKKVRNAVMELLQFKSINGKKFNNLRIVWAAINPDDVKSEGDDEFEYDVEKLDPAQKDRFEVQVSVPFKPDRGYFTKKFGDDITENAIDWWNDLDNKARRGVSPRRLDYALNVYIKGGDIRDVLPSNVNVSKLVTELKNGSFIKLMKGVFIRKDVEEAKKFMAIRNNYDNTIERILKNNEMIEFFIPCLKEEDLINLMISSKAVYEHVVRNHAQYETTIKNIFDVNQHSKLAKKLKKESSLKPTDLLKTLGKNLLTGGISSKFTFSTPSLRIKPIVKNQYGVQFSGLSGQTYTNFINDATTLNNAIRKGTQYRIGIFHKILQNISNADTHSNYDTSLKYIVNIIVSSHPQSLMSTPYRGLAELFGFLLIRTAETSPTQETVQSTIGKLSSMNGRFDKMEAFMVKNSKLYV